MRVHMGTVDRAPVQVELPCDTQVGEKQLVPGRPCSGFGPYIERTIKSDRSPADRQVERPNTRVAIPRVTALPHPLRRAAPDREAHHGG
jgi:hypothetical protein